MSRKDIRSAVATESKELSEPGELDTESLLVLKAIQFATDDDGFDLGLEELIGRADFDHALDMNMERICIDIPSLDVSGFFAGLMTAAHERFDVMGDHVVRFTLFALAMCGPREAVADVATPEKLDKLATSFRSSGLAGGNASVFLLPHLLDFHQAAILMPGMLGRILAATADYVATNEGEPASYVSEIIGFGPSQDAAANGTVNRLLLGVHSQIDGVGNMPPAIDCEDDDAVGEWQELATEVIGQGVTIHLPTDVVEAGVLMCLDRIANAIDLEAMARGCRTGRRYDEMRVWRGEEDALWVSARIGGKSIGPVSCPARLALGLPILFHSHLADLSEKVLEEPDAPHGGPLN